MFIVGNPAYPSYQVLLAAGVAAVITAVVMPAATPAARST